MGLRSAFILVCGLLLRIVAAADSDPAEFPDDPYLAYRPAFARSLPVQIMLTGVVLTLVAVLFIHLMFTAQYHWPLAPVNYVLQLSGVTTLLISLIATIHVVLSTTFAESEKWPYMLSYIAVNVPPLDTLDVDQPDDGWSVAERATWLVMNASTSGLIQITHIQFLTLLYPSKLEGRLIFALLGPLAVVAAVMQLLPISGSESVSTVAAMVRNVCNATLSLLFTLALFIWGLLVNRKQAWRTDGGTAVFGCAALSLAVVSTALNFLYIHKAEEFVWLPGLMWAVVLWQSFLGWWWWVGAGSGGAFVNDDEDSKESVEERIRKEQKREARRKETTERRRQTKMRAQRIFKDAFSSASGTNAATVTGRSASREPSLSAISHRRSRTPHSNNVISQSRTSPPEGENAASTAASNFTRSPSDSRTLAQLSTVDGTTSSDLSHSLSLTSTATTSTVTSTSAITDVPRFLPRVIHRWYAYIRHAHNAAARVQAAERVERIRELAAEERGRAGGAPNEEVGWGWGWEGFGWIKRRRATTNIMSVNKEDSSSRSRSRSRNRGRDNEVYEMQPSSRSRGEEDEEDDMYVSEEEDRQIRRVSRAQQEAEQPSALPLWDPSYPLPNTPTNVNDSATGPTPVAMERPRSMWWWGPLFKWRLQDSTSYK